MTETFLRIDVACRSAWIHATAATPEGHPRRSERGEGVISAAIAVLIMAFLGASMWVLFDQVFDDTNAKTQNQVEQIGR